jgi:hypothetical protein
MRATLIDWLVEVQRQFTLVLETFHLTVGIIDRYLQVCFIWMSQFDGYHVKRLKGQFGKNYFLLHLY